jgi:hypothetical protein
MLEGLQAKRKAGPLLGGNAKRHRREGLGRMPILQRNRLGGRVKQTLHSMRRRGLDIRSSDPMSGSLTTFLVISMPYLGNRRRCSVPLHISIILRPAGNSCGRIGTSDLAARIWNDQHTKQLPTAIVLVDNSRGVPSS